MNKSLSSVSFVLLLLSSPLLLNAQMKSLHGDEGESRFGIHSGNNFRVSMTNDGKWGGPASTINVWPGEWPINSGHIYLIEGIPRIISEVYDNYDPNTKIILTSKGTLRHIQAVAKLNEPFGGPSARFNGTLRHIQGTDKFETRDFDFGRIVSLSFLPLPGFANSNSDKIAMAKRGTQWEDSWPLFWPDIADPSNPVFSPDGWTGAWNGYFGKNKFNADEESYFVADDYQRQKFLGFRPDTNDVARGGLGIRMYVRGFQWDQPGISDVIFCHYKFENIGTYRHNKMVFGYKIGDNVGDTMIGGDGADDGGSYNQVENIAWGWDNNGIGHASWGPGNVGVFGGAFLESPGNPFDGIDNDNDGISGTGLTITTTLFQKSVLQSAAQIVLIDYTDPHYKRVVTTLSDTLSKLGKASTDTLTVIFEGTVYKFYAGDSLKEIGDNLFDDNLNGIIDENRGVTQNDVTNYLYVDHKYIDYITGSGKDNLLIDERRDDGIDNDGNWNALTDDVGKDGVGPNDPLYTGADVGEGDGIPTPGEPHFDETDINESDLLGLTSFRLYAWGAPWNDYDDEAMWHINTPGLFFEDPVGNVELAFGSGYFSIMPGKTERISMALIPAEGGSSGRDTVSLFEMKKNTQAVYYNNYRLPVAPKIPILQGSVVGNIVTLSWNNLAESFIDPVLGVDFEGYRLYRSVNPFVFDSSKLIAQFDLDNEYEGYSPVVHRGRYFWLGNNSGLQHSFVDTVPDYGFDYYYAVTAYDHGDNALKIPPGECSIPIYRNESGEIITGDNTILIVPIDTAGVKYPTSVSLTQGLSEGSITCEVVDTRLVKRNHTYRITFEDTTRIIAQIKNFTVTDITNGDTVFSQIPFYNQHSIAQVMDGLRLTLENVGNGVLEMIEDSCRWNRTGVTHSVLTPFYVSASTPRRLLPADFKIIFGDVGIDTSKQFRRGTVTLPAKPVNFTVFNTLNGAKVPFAFRELSVLTDTGKFSFNRAGTSDQIITLLPKAAGNDTLVGNWVVSLVRIASDTLLPDVGDTLVLKSNRPFLAETVFEFTTPDIPVEVAEQDDNNVPKQFSLSQNFPNPFNPTTTIRFALPVKSDVRLYMVNTLGQIVKELAKGNYTAGYHQVILNGSNLASGVYFYRIETNSGFVQAKKLVLVK